MFSRHVYGGLVRNTESVCNSSCTYLYGLSNVFLRNIDEKSFSGLTGLTSLDLGNNPLQSLPADFLGGLPSLGYFSMYQFDASFAYRVLGAVEMACVPHFRNYFIFD